MHKSKRFADKQLFNDIILSVSRRISKNKGRIRSTQKFTLVWRLERIFCLKLSVEKLVEGYGVK